MVRSSMTDLIDTLRGLAHAGTDDFTIGIKDYWSDDQLQTILDRYRANLREAELVSHSLTNTGGTVEYKEYSSYAGWFEATTEDGSATFVITDGIGSITPSASYTPKYETGLVTFDDDQAGSARYVTGQSYDVYAAAADVWEQKAAHYATQIDFSTDGHKITRSHIVDQCDKMATKYNSMSISGGGSIADVMRGDYNGA